MERPPRAPARRFVLFALVALGLGAALVALRPRSTPSRPGARSEAEPALATLAGPSSVEQRLPPLADDLEVLLVGGGAEPESAGVQLEQDIAHARATFGGPTLVLFGGGPSVLSVRESAPEPEAGDALFGRLAEVFDPRPRGARYRPTTLAPDAPATAELVREAFARLLGRPGAPLLVYVAAHGEQGESPSENTLVLWGSTVLGPPDLGAILADPATVRPSRLVVTSCFGGGFADAVFDPRAPEGIPVAGDHCGLFATDWDHVASGCDTDPVRSRQEGYALHVLAALRGRDRDGHALARASIDLDGDGAIGLLDAHTHARIAGRSFDLPITTSDHYLRVWAERNPLDERVESGLADPHEDAVVAALGEELDARDVRIAEAVRDRLRDEAADADGALAEVEAQRDESFYGIRIELLERFPILDDPWHPEFQATLAANRRAIETILARSPNAVAYAEAERRVSELGAEVDAARIRLARAERLVAAYHHRARAAAMRRRDPTAFARYVAMRRCERWAPPLRPEQAR